MDRQGMRVLLSGTVYQPPGWWFAIIRDTVIELKDRAIAHQLGISYNTLRTQLGRLYRKLGVQTRIGVAVAVFSEAMRIVAEGRHGK